MRTGFGRTDTTPGRQDPVRLDTLKQQTGQKPEDLIPIFTALLRRLREIHAADLSHADLSPRNIYLQAGSVTIDTFPRRGAQETVLVADAKYTAPELLITQTVPDAATNICADIYVLGFVLYELLIGREQMDRQFAKLAEASTGLGWMRWHVDPTQTVQPLASLLPSCPKPLSDLIERMLEKDASKRIRTFEEVERVFDSLLVRFRETDEIRIPPSGSATARRKRTRIDPWVTLVLLLGIIGVGAVWWFGMAWWRARATRTGMQGTSVSAAAETQATSGRPRVLHTPTGTMVLVPEGEFLMGDDAIPAASPAHKVSVAPFYIDRLEVTNAAYREFCNRTQRQLPTPPAFDPDYLSKPNYPVVNVGWEDAQAFCESAGKRLPSEAEWEKAARGTEDPSTVWANWTLPGVANLPGAVGRPAPGGSFPSDVSPFGALDMAGNVQEWIADEYQLYERSSGTLSQTEAGQRLVRGGSFAHKPPQLSPAWRGLPPARTNGLNLNTIGFRCAADVGISSKGD